MEKYAWLIWSLGFLSFWGVVYFTRPSTRKQMLRMSLFTAPLGLTEPLFVPAYWNPPTLFGLAQRTGFDIESLIFCFSIGGIATVLYEMVVPAQHVPMHEDEKHDSRHRFHLLALASPIIVFVPLMLTTSWNAIYPGILAMIIGTMASLWCRPDLKGKIWVGGGVFLVLYFLFFQLLDLAFPGYVEKYWTLDALSGIITLGIPIEEYLFAFTFGLMWSSLYEHISWQKITPSPPKAHSPDRKTHDSQGGTYVE
ncbi:hypothetical protein BMS3Abin14_01565 [bacterium BMS3Abin14]|nr:hypothetical protein BMS3Abin14_01565 [bacterium BMS3Abin14]